MKLAIIESGGANFLSVTTALDRLQVEYQFTKDKQVIEAADGVLLPGVGTAGFAMDILHKSGLVEVIRNIKQPLLGICLGMQLLYEFSEEDNCACLGIIPGRICHFNQSSGLIVPHMGWNNLATSSSNQIINDLNKADDVYFVHSYYAPLNSATVASCNYGTEFTAVANYNNFYGMQFHPEKSGKVGALLLNNFLNIVKSESLK